MKVEIVDLGYDPVSFGHRWVIRLQDSLVEARIYKGDLSRTYRISVFGRRRRADGLLAAQAIALEMLGVKNG